jgi:D-glycero-D-manno-heptose 1,7-bisphosphate phosphatase
MTMSDPPRPRFAAVLFDRDGTLVVDEPYCADPELVRPMPAARAALAMVRATGTPIGIVSNQSGIGRGLIPPAAATAVQRRVEELLGPFDTVQICPHAPEAGCDCRKPRPGMLLAAAAELGVPAERLAMIGDIGADVDAARAAGATAVLVPTGVTRAEEVRRAPVVKPDLVAAVEYLLDPARVAG